MSLSRGRAGPPAEDVDTIDLTLSPSPEPRPQPRPQQQQQRRYPAVQHRVSKHYRTTSTKPRDMASVKKEGASSESATRAAPSQTNRIHPDHLRQIITTSDPAAVRNVLLNLCKLSPALSGAVARGLAPHSAFAQATITTHQAKAGAANIKPDPEPKREVSLTNRTGNPSGSSMLRPHIKHERERSPLPSEDDSDSTLGSDIRLTPSPGRPKKRQSTPYHRAPYVVEASQSPTSSDRAVPARPPLKHIPQGQTTNLNRVLSSAPASWHKPIRVKSEPEYHGQQCERCRQLLFEDETDHCIYHPGRKIMISQDGERIAVFSCCKMRIGEPGCKTGYHIAKPIEGFDTIKRAGPTSRSPFPTSGPLKKPRLL
ncbi:hypothetical protein BU26DRAFT_555603 [Trematosphaeria pertusa]|uniref:Uncharacterized protein n=1 Tax=Trematosphaeria pertusa TaxID=390896 RepID=A0A6A6HX92_9PLEO|nr:uncharacterized protein BU26DRAFT_555603 [Trematosphaeria pertusa]KAF2242388.1 hypothetical protein BU26DRAFT_555603 [Trematosphaeria pertusa]